jgi:hypothetical protein
LAEKTCSGPLCLRSRRKGAEGPSEFVSDDGVPMLRRSSSIEVAKEISATVTLAFNCQRSGGGAPRGGCFQKYRRVQEPGRGYRVSGRERPVTVYRHRPSPIHPTRRPPTPAQPLVTNH